MYRDSLQLSTGAFDIVWDLRGYISGLFDYFSRRDVIEWDAVSKQVNK